ncbi:hypothetical protein SETIT_7G241500v2 [Setaria italica]|uniref:NB-ARC domain-containing protein n=1 Tax=Setaria italica TaxID=4555 RepID=A0A368RZ85_SETIT|nr:hypothetical protein SETIT_7G241500v2 [Setaria italica]
MGVVVDAAIGWLVQSILGNCFTEKLEAWTCTVGLADDVEKLKSAMRYVQMVLDAAKGRKIKSEPLENSLGDLKELLYDAEDVMDELDYYRLQENITNRNTGGHTDAAARIDGTSSTWSLSSIQQLGSTLISNFGNFIFKGNLTGKRKREDDRNIAVSTHLGNNCEFSCRIKHIAGKLRDVGHDVSDALKMDGSNLVGSQSMYRSTPQATRLTTSYLVEHKVYGRDAEKEYILKLMTSKGSNGLTVLPIVGIGGVGKTTLAQFVYNDPIVRRQFEIKIWVCVSDNFDVIRLTREMLDCVSKQRLAETGNLNKLQEDLEKHMQSKRFLIVLDDVWDDMNSHCWDQLLAPVKHNQAMGNMILVTTRKLSVAKMTQTIEPVKLGALEGGDFWQFFQSCAFDDERYVHPSLYAIGKQIAQKLRGNPLAAKTVGALLRRNINVDEWTNILNNEEWKCIQATEGIIPALKLSYDYLPDHLQQCFRYCCLFPKDYRFNGGELVRIWISQGFVHVSHTTKNLEDIGKVYLVDLVNSGFFQQVERYLYPVNSGFFQQNKRDWHSSNFVMHDLMHDLARKVSRGEHATIDGSKCEEFLPTMRHLLIVTDSAYFGKRRQGNAFSCENFGKQLQVASVRKLRSLVLIGYYDPHFFKYFQNIFKELISLRLLQISATYADFSSFINNLVSCTHIRYMKVHFYEQRVGTLPRALTNFFHLQVLDVGFLGHLTLPSGMSNLVSLQHLVAAEEVHYTIADIGNMTSLQELPKYKVRNTSGFDIKQLKSMSQLVHLGIYQLENVRNKQEASEARLIDKGLLKDLHLSWDVGSTNSEISAMTATEVLEGLEPNQNLKNLQITGYSGSISPSWLATDLLFTSLQLLHLENCKKWRVLPSLEKLPSLKKLKLINICDVVEVRIPCLEELVLTELPSLEKCVATYRRGLNFHLQVLIMENCPKLSDFTPFQIQNFRSFGIEQKSWMPSLAGTSADKVSSNEAEQKEWAEWLSGVRVLIIHGCPRLMAVLPPLPPSTNARVSINGLSTHPRIRRTYSRSLLITSSNEMTKLDDKILAFQNLTEITSLHIEDSPNLVSLSSEGFRKLLNLRELEIVRCGNLVSSCVNVVSEDWKTMDCPALPCLTRLRIESCGSVAGRWLTEMLPHMLSLEKLDIHCCPQIQSISVHYTNQEEHVSFSPSPERIPTRLAQDEFHLHIPLNVISTLRSLHIQSCPEMELCGSKEWFRGFTSLMELKISYCPKLLSSTNEKFPLPPSIQEMQIECLPTRLQPYFLENQTSLKNLVVGCSPDLHSLRLHFCTALEMNPKLSAAWVLKCQDQEGSTHTLLPRSLEVLRIKALQDETVPYLMARLPSLTQLELGFLRALKKLDVLFCKSLASLEGLQSLGSLTDLTILGCYSITPCLNFMSQQAVGFNLFPRLERIKMDDFSALTTSFCKHLTSVQHLVLLENSNSNIKRACLTDEQEKALQLLTSLRKLRFIHCKNLVHLPAVLHSLPSLKKLFVQDCPCIARLPEKGLPPSLEKLKIIDCSAELNEKCRMLAKMIKVKIDRGYVN